MRKYDSSNNFFWHLNEDQRKLYIIYHEKQTEKRETLKNENIFDHKSRENAKCGRNTLVTIQQQQFALITSSGGKGGVGEFNNLTWLSDNEYIVEDMFCTYNYKYDKIKKDWNGSTIRNNVEKQRITKKEHAKLYIFRDFCLFIGARIFCRDLWSNIFIILEEKNGLFNNYEDFYATKCVFKHFFISRVCSKFINLILEGEFVKRLPSKIRLDLA